MRPGAPSVHLPFALIILPSTRRPRPGLPSCPAGPFRLAPCTRRATHLVATRPSDLSLTSSLSRPGVSAAAAAAPPAPPPHPPPVLSL